MRKDNYMIALLNTHSIDLNVPPWLACLLPSPPVNNGCYNKWIEKLVYIIFLDQLFLPNGKLNEAFLNNTDSVVFWFRLAGVINIAAAPLLAIIVAYSFILENFHRYYSNRVQLTERDWRPIAMWNFREFNELSLLFEKRMKLAYIPTELYVSGYFDKFYSIIGRVVCFLSGSIVTALLCVSLLDEDVLFHMHFVEHNLIWYLGFFSIIFALFRSMTPDYHTRHHSPEKLMAQIVKAVHHVPSHWLLQCESNKTRREVSQLFPLKVELFLTEIFTLLVSPVILLYSVPRTVPSMVKCVRRFTRSIADFGDHCCLTCCGHGSLPVASFDSVARRYSLFQMIGL